MTKALPSLALCCALWISAFSSADVTPEAAAILALPEQIRVPRMQTPPTVNGVIADGEYDQAIGLAGVHTHLSGLSPRQAAFMVGADGKRLYIAMRLRMRDGELPIYRDRRRDQAQVTDSSLEMRLTVPRRRQADAGQEIGPYLFVANARGAVTDALEALEIGQTFWDWNTEVDSASTFRDGLWELEFAVDLDSMLPGGYRDGEAWGLMLARNWHDPWDQAALRIPFRAPLEMRLGASPAAVSMGTVAGLYDGTNSQELIVRNIASEPLDARLHYIVHREGSQKRGDPPPVTTLLAHTTETISLAPGESKTFHTIPYDPTSQMVITSHEKSLAEQEKRAPRAEKIFDPYVLELAVTDAAGTEVYYRRRIEVSPLERAAEREFTGNPRKFNYEVAYYKSRERLRVNVDSFTMPERDRAHRARVTIRDGGEKSIATFDMPPFVEYFTTAHEDRKLPAGAYAARVEVLDEAGAVLATDTYAFTLEDHPWETCTLGTSDRLLPWFEPCRYLTEPATLVCWNRAYRMADTGLPVRITANTDPDRQPVIIGGWQEVDHLVSPMRIEIDDANGTQRSDRIEGDGFVVTALNEAFILGKGGFELNGLRVDISSRFEPDGMLRMTVTYQPAGEAPVEIRGMRLIAPLQWAMAERVTHPVMNGKPHTSKLLDQAPGVQWESTDPMAKVPMTVGSFVPMLWLGTPENGLVYWADGDRGWVPSEAKAAIAVIGSEDRSRRDLVFNIVSEPYTLTAARTFEMAFEATPARPHPPATKGKSPEHKVRGWSMVDMVKSGRGPNRGAARTVDCMDYEKWSQFASLPRNHTTAEYDPNGRRYDHGAIHIETGSKRNVPAGFPDWNTREFPESYLRFMAWHMQKWLTIPYGIDAYYFDCVSVSTPCHDVDSGLGYELPDGRIQPEFAMFDLRDYFKRAAMVPVELGRPSANTFHTSGPHQYIHCYPFVEERIEGEHSRVPIPPEGPAPVIARLGEKMMLNRSLAWGVPVTIQLNNEWAPGVPDPEDRRKTDMAELAMWRITSAAGAIPGGTTGYGNDEHLGAFHFAHRRTLDPEKSWTLIPPWRAPRWFGNQHPDLRIIAWKSERRMLFYLANWSDKPLNTTISPDWFGLGFNLDGEYEIQNLLDYGTDRSRRTGTSTALRKLPDALPTWRARLEPNTIEGFLFIQYAWPNGRQQNGAPYARQTPVTAR